MSNKGKVSLSRLFDSIFNFFLAINLFSYRIFEPEFWKKYESKLQKQNMSLTFYDDFSTTSIDTSKWSNYSWWGGNYHPADMYQWYDIDSCKMIDGILNMNIENNPKLFDDGITRKYAVANLNNSKVFEQKYGYFEIKCKIPSKKGTWPAFWLASKYSWPPEIDIFEFYTGKKKDCWESNVHWGKEPKHPSRVMGHNIWKSADKFHVYAIDWKEDKMDFFWNGILIRRVTDKQILREFEYPMHIMFNNGIDLGEDRGFDEINLPLTFKVMWIRAYKHN